MIFVEENDDRFYIDNSTLPNAGFGLFAKEKIQKGDWLEVIGIMVKKGGIADKCTHYANRYKFAGTKDDAKIVPMGYAGIINHTDDLKLKNVELTCIRGLSKRSQHSSEIVYQAIRDIEPGEELLGNYGNYLSKRLEQTNDNLDFHKKIKTDWDDFLKHDLYNLKKICTILNETTP